MQTCTCNCKMLEMRIARFVGFENAETYPSTVNFRSDAAENELAEVACLMILEILTSWWLIKPLRS